MSITAAMVKELRQKTDAPMMACKKALQQVDGDMEAAIKALREAGEAKAAKRASKTAAEGVVLAAASNDGKAAFIVDVNSETDFVARDESFAAFAQNVLQKGLATNVADVEALSALALEGDLTVEAARQQLISKLGENIQIRRVARLNAAGVVGHYCHGSRIGVLVALDQNNPELARDIAMHVAATSPQAIAPEDVSQDLIAKEREIFIAQAKESGKPEAIIAKMVDGRVNKFLKEVSLTSQPFVKDPSRSVADLLKEHGATIEAFVRFEVGEGIEKETQNFADEVMAQVKGND